MNKVVVTWNDEEIPISTIVFVSLLVSLGLIGLACKQVERSATKAYLDSWIFSLIIGAVKSSQWLGRSYTKQLLFK